MIDWKACIADGADFGASTEAQMVQEFRAPFKGYYRFSFSACTSNRQPVEETKVEVKLDGETKFWITDGAIELRNNIAATWIWKMDLDSRVGFTVASNELLNTYDSPVTFTGQLIMLVPDDDPQ